MHIAHPRERQRHALGLRTYQPEPPVKILLDQRVRRVDRFFATNYDEDHISDLPDLREELHISLLCRNESISADQLERLKLRSGPLTPAMKSMLDMIRKYNLSSTSSPEFPRVHYSTFRNSYGTDFRDTNNISLVTFLACGSLRFIIPGDLETEGWELLLRNKNFQEKLFGVDIFVASHHGRENGYCADVFKFCKPKVVVFSDSSIQHATQEMASIYARHASGVKFKGETRYALSTRNDGSLCWEI